MPLPPPEPRGEDEGDCPDCGAPWPYPDRSCPSCGLTVEDVADRLADR